MRGAIFDGTTLILSLSKDMTMGSASAPALLTQP